MRKKRIKLSIWFKHLRRDSNWFLYFFFLGGPILAGLGMFVFDSSFFLEMHTYLVTQTILLIFMFGILNSYGIGENSIKEKTDYLKDELESAYQTIIRDGLGLYDYKRSVKHWAIDGLIKIKKVESEYVLMSIEELKIAIKYGEEKRVRYISNMICIYFILSSIVIQYWNF